jgi:hypothetical protein
MKRVPSRGILKPSSPGEPLSWQQQQQQLMMLQHIHQFQQQQKQWYERHMYDSRPLSPPRAATTAQQGVRRTPSIGATPRRFVKREIQTVVMICNKLILAFATKKKQLRT